MSDLIVSCPTWHRIACDVALAGRSFHIMLYRLSNALGTVTDYTRQSVAGLAVLSVEL